MSREDLRNKLHDYVDGRLHGQERCDFEALVSRDPELAARLETYRAIGRALRETGAELPAGFHARARARFERRPHARTGFAWPVSWEVTGLAAAALLLVAILLPVLLPERHSGGSAPAPDRNPEAAGPETTSSTEASRGHAGEARQPAARTEVDHAPEDERAAAVEQAAAPPPAPEPPAEPRRDRPQRGPSPAATAPLSPVPSPPRSLGKNERSTLAKPTSLEIQTGVPARAAPLPEGSVARGVVRLIDDRASWERFTAGMPLEWPRLPAPDFSKQRVVLVGPDEDPWDCRSCTWHEDGGTIVIVMVPASERTIGGRGCAVIVPSGPGPVRLEKGSR